MPSFSASRTVGVPRRKLFTWICPSMVTLLYVSFGPRTAESFSSTSKKISFARTGSPVMGRCETTLGTVLGFAAARKRRAAWSRSHRHCQRHSPAAVRTSTGSRLCCIPSASAATCWCTARSRSPAARRAARTPARSCVAAIPRSGCRKSPAHGFGVRRSTHLEDADDAIDQLQDERRRHGERRRRHEVQPRAPHMVVHHVSDFEDWSCFLSAIGNCAVELLSSALDIMLPSSRNPLSALSLRRLRSRSRSPLPDITKKHDMVILTAMCRPLLEQRMCAPSAALRFTARTARPLKYNGAMFRVLYCGKPLLVR
ncbi:response regulator [Babesia caballi]|uniref:Response regulator n=1 Tax=Babesia caballi TaxID=5871 RepID=A0AAV4LV46_BABCB|nr:response regulator [Babesia caballi]